MAPVQPRKRKSSTSPTSTPQRSPIKRRKVGLSLAQKQALIENLQLEITERARRLRAQYNVQAQQLRSRVEMRVNRIPTSLRKAKMGELFAKHSEPQPSRAARSQYVTRPPPVPAKDGTSPKPIPRKPVSTNGAHARRPHNPVSDEMASVYDKENSAEPIAIPKKKSRAGLVAAEASVQPSHVLSPTSTNARVAPRATERPTSPVKSGIGRPPSLRPRTSRLNRPPISCQAWSKRQRDHALQPHHGKLLHQQQVEALLARALDQGSPPLPAAATTASTRGRRKVSGASESSESSTSTVVKKSTASRANATKPPPPTKRTVMGTIKSATSKKAPASKATAAPASTTGTGRTLRKRA
ncbi:hypothetical protein PG997_004452 [Apiospora hydei]|uniref:Borealin N-terminal domain-containing protein n=1 Tax=Apiospora hydei TaxID=1337664 RepID=A0ABR1X273_9PEZI